MPGSCSRRKFITHYLCANAIVLGCNLALGACSSKKSIEENTSKTSDPCGDLSGVSESELEKRNKLGYVREAPVPEKQCNMCKLYLPPKTDEKCGGCMLFKGPVDAKGSCTYWAPLV